LPVQTAASPADAMAAASEHRERTVVAGSLFLVGAVRAWLDTAPVPRDPA
jgi:hypothetical protein